MVCSSGETCHPYTSYYLVQASGGIILISRPTFMDISIFFQDNTSFKFPLSTHTHTHTVTHTNYIYIYLHIIMHVSTRTCYIHHKRGVTEVWHMTHFWVSYGRCTMPGSAMVLSARNTKKNPPLHASRTLMVVLPCLDHP